VKRSAGGSAGAIAPPQEGHADDARTTLACVHVAQRANTRLTRGEPSRTHLNALAAPPTMGRIAAVVWGLVGVVPIVGGALEIPDRIGEITSGYGVRDARTILFGASLSVALGLLAFGCAWREWRGKRVSGWLVLPAATLTAGVFEVAFLVRASWELVRWTALLASPFALWFLGPALVGGALIVGLTRLAEGRASRFAKPR